jgi:hypothetical protein
MDSFLFTFGGDAVSNFQLMSGGEPARCGDLQERRDYGGKRAKRPTKYNKNRIFTAISPT